MKRVWRKLLARIGYGDPHNELENTSGASVRRNNKGRITHVTLRDRTITDGDLSHLEPLACLRRLHLYGPRVIGSGLRYIASLVALEELSVRGIPLTDEGLVHLQALRNLVRLSLGETKVTDAGLDHLQGLSKIQTLSLQATRITDDGLDQIKAMEGIRELNLSQTEITDNGLAKLVALNYLTELDLYNCEQVTDAGMVHISQLGDLQRLVAPNKMTGEGLQQLVKLANLQALELSSTQITDADVGQLTGMRLRALALPDAARTDSGFAHYLESVRYQTDLHLDDWEITDSGLGLIKGYSNLKSLRLRNTLITDAGLVSLKGMDYLDYLTLDNTRVTDRGLVELAGLINLKHLSVKNTDCTTESIDALKQALPRCEILDSPPRGSRSPG